MQLLEIEALRDIPLLVFANKQDLNGLGADEIIDSLNLNNIHNRTWSLYACSGLTGVGKIRHIYIF